MNNTNIGNKKEFSRAYHEDRILVYPPKEKDAVSLHYTDLSRLAEGQKLNDNIIDFYLRYLIHR
jgi:Ulp1 family protease